MAAERDFSAQESVVDISGGSKTYQEPAASVRSLLAHFAAEYLGLDS